MSGNIRMNLGHDRRKRAKPDLVRPSPAEGCDGYALSRILDRCETPEQRAAVVAEMVERVAEGNAKGR